MSGWFRLGRMPGTKTAKQVGRKVLTNLRNLLYYDIVLRQDCAANMSRVRSAGTTYGFILDSYSLRGSTNETLQRHVLSEDNISVSVWRVFQPSRVSPGTRCERFRGFVDSVMI